MRFFDFTVLNYQGVPLATVAAKDSAAVKVEVEGLCERKGWVGDEANLPFLSDWGAKFWLG